MKLIKNYDAMKYLGAIRDPEQDVNISYKKNTSIDPMDFLKRYSLPTKKKRVTYTKAEDGIYKRIEEDGTDEGFFVTSIFFVQEPELGEGKNSAVLSYELIDLINNKYGCSVSDDFPHLNTDDTNVCYREFESKSIDALKELRGMIGKHVFMKDGALVIEEA